MVHCIATCKAILHVIAIFRFRETRFLVFGSLKMGVVQIMDVAPKEFEEFTPTLKW